MVYKSFTIYKNSQRNVLRRLEYGKGRIPKLEIIARAIYHKYMLKIEKEGHTAIQKF